MAETILKNVGIGRKHLFSIMPQSGTSSSQEFCAGQVVPEISPTTQFTSFPGEREIELPVAHEQPKGYRIFGIFKYTGGSKFPDELLIPVVYLDECKFASIMSDRFETFCGQSRASIYAKIIADYQKSFSQRPPPLTTLIESILASLISEPLEDGCSHPTKEALSKAILNHQESFYEWLRNMIMTEPNYSLVADIIKSLGRFHIRDLGETAIELTRLGLNHTHVEVRDASVRALESWGTASAIHALKTHETKESSDWLRQYIHQIIAELEQSSR